MLLRQVLAVFFLEGARTLHESVNWPVIPTVRRNVAGAEFGRAAVSTGLPGFTENPLARDTISVLVESVTASGSEVKRSANQLPLVRVMVHGSMQFLCNNQRDMSPFSRWLSNGHRRSLRCYKPGPFFFFFFSSLCSRTRSVCSRSCSPGRRIPVLRCSAVQNYWAGMCLSIAETHLTRELIMDPLNEGRPAQEKFRWSSSSRRVGITRNQPCYLCPAQSRHAGDILAHQPFFGFAQARILLPHRPPLGPGINFVAALPCKMHFAAPGQKRPNLLQARRFRIVHADDQSPASRSCPSGSSCMRIQSPSQAHLV